MGAEGAEIDGGAAFGAGFFQHFPAPSAVDFPFFGKMPMGNEGDALAKGNRKVGGAGRIGAEGTGARGRGRFHGEFRLCGRHKAQLGANLPDDGGAERGGAPAFVHRERGLAAPHLARKGALAEVAALARLFDLASKGLHVGA